MAGDGVSVIDPLAALASPFPDNAISWRVGSTNIDKKTGEPKNNKPAAGIALAYIDARDVMERLDSVVGRANWSDHYVETEKGRVICELSIRIEGEWIVKSDGAGDSDVESEKGAISDALKRAAVKWGIGRYLYNMDSPWVDLDRRGNSWVMKPAERKKLDQIHHNYVVNNFTNPDAGHSDAGQREQPKAQQATGAGGSPPSPAPVQVLSKAQARPDFGEIVKEVRACQSEAELQDWGKRNIKRVELQPPDWVKEIRKEYGDMLEGFRRIAKAAADAQRAFAEERR